MVQETPNPGGTTTTQKVNQIILPPVNPSDITLDDLGQVIVKNEAFKSAVDTQLKKASLPTVAGTNSVCGLGC